MSDYKEKFEKMKVAGNLAARTLDMLTENIKEGVSTDYIDKLGYEFIRDNGGYSAPLYYRGFTKSLCTSIKRESMYESVLPVSTPSTSVWYVARCAAGTRASMACSVMSDFHGGT